MAQGSLLSVVIPVFGRAESAARAVASALAQDGVDLEVLAVDDGSPKPFAPPLNDPRFSVLRLEGNRGAAAARNAGVAAARGEWIAFLDSDDAWPAGALRPRVEAAQAGEAPERTIWASAFVEIEPGGACRAPRLPRASARVADFASGCWSCPGSTALFSRAAWARSGGQDEALRRLEDFDWLLRWGLGGGRLAVHEAVGAEISRGPRAAPALVDEAAALIAAKHDGLAPTLKRRMRAYLELERGAARLGAARPLEAGAALARSWLLHPRAQPALERFWI